MPPVSIAVLPPRRFVYLCCLWLVQLLQFLHRCLSAEQQLLLLQSPSSTRGSEATLLLQRGAALLKLRLEEAGVLAALIDSVCNSLPSSSNSASSSSRNRQQQKLPPRLLCCVLVLLQHSVESSHNRALVIRLIGGIAASLRPRLQQLLQRSANRRFTAASVNGSKACNLGGVELQLLSAQLDCLGTATAAAAGDRRGCEALCCSLSDGKWIL